MNLFSTCPHVCDNKNANGFCNTTACINPRYNGTGTYKIVVSDHTEQDSAVFDGTRKTNGGAE